MPSTPLLNRLKADFTQFSFVEADRFRWSAESQTIHIDPQSDTAEPFLLHELGHALLNHQSYAQDIDLLKLERDAWHLAVTKLSHIYNVVIDSELIQDNLDTYREWLHARSLCPACHMTGLQSTFGSYTCLACGCHWKSNDARHCALRRHVVSAN